MAPKGLHSEKPGEIADRVERLYPHAARLELFCRSPRPGWSAWGDQVEVGPQPASVKKPRVGKPRA
ncbi:MT-A70 family methyltransferase [Brevundimonas aveniformis]|uniref:MT-A70 family methyltransferase n=1 Tax=Brevundimonas aveniformis TaxID=370977 RepID=UPI003CD0CA69